MRRRLSRRAFIRGGALLGGAVATGAAAGAPAAPARATGAVSSGATSSGAAAAGAAPAGAEGGRAVMVGSANALRGMETAMSLLLKGDDPLGAVLAGIHDTEDDPEDVTVGYGGIPNEEGVVELDAAVMEGRSLRSGSVGALRGIRHPSSVARLIMERTDRVFLVGDGALRFARAHGFREEDLLTARSRKIWLFWKERLADHDDWIESGRESQDPDIRWYIETYGDEDFRPQGTVHISARAPSGDLYACTSTSGLFFKLPGRLGDSPVIGAGLYTDNRAGSCGATGRGEACISVCGSHTVVEFMRQGVPPEEAGLRALRRIVESDRRPHHLDARGRPRYDVKFYCVNPKGEAAGVAIWSGARYALHDGRKGALRDCAYLFKKEPAGA